MKYPILFGSLLGGIMLIGTLTLAVVFPVHGFLQDPFSTIMNIPNIMPYFTFFGTIFGILLTAFIYSAFREFGKVDLKTKLEIFITSVFGFLMIWTPWNDYQIFFKWLHTISGLLVAVGVLILAIRFNKISGIKDKIIDKIREKIPLVMGIGTLGLWITTGINMLMETYFFFLATVWLIIVGIVIKRK